APYETAAFAELTAIPLARSAKLTPTMTLVNPSVIALGTTGMSLHEVATSGATNPSGPPLTVTFGLPTADEPCAPGYGSGGISSLTQVDHCVSDEKLPLIVSQVDLVEEVSIPVTSLMKFSALLGLGMNFMMPAIAMLASVVRPISTRPIAMLVR